MKLGLISFTGIDAIRANLLRMARATRPALPLLLVAACGFPRPADVGDDVPGDASDPGITVRVSPAGDDGNDGILQPVKTLKHAIGLAAANTQITRIVLASGSYSMSSGETFPYTVPPNVTIAGPAGGGAILAGTKAEPGMTVDSGGLQDLDLQNFTVAITVTGMASLKNIRVLTSTIAVQAETDAKLTVDHLDIAGTAGACTTGIVLIGAAQLIATTLTTRNLGMTLDARAQSATTISNATLMGDRGCTQSMMAITSNATFSISDSLLDGGSAGISLSPRLPTPKLQSIISKVIIRNTKGGALGAGGRLRDSMSLQMTDSELSNNEGVGASLGGGTWILKNVMIQQNRGLAIYLQDGLLTMRDCTVTGNEHGVNVFANADADLGTVADPGNNVFQMNTSVGLSVDGNMGATLVEAVGNTWNPRTQGTNDAGRYPMPDTITVSVPYVPGNNFLIANGWSLSR